jgi:hypothetical protein
VTRAGLALAALALAACTETPTVTVVTVSARPAVQALASLDVTFANDNATLTEQFDLRGVTLPATFSVETPGRSGTLEMTASALGADGTKAARGSAEVAIRPDDVSTVELLLDPDDFVVNTVTAQDQQLIFFLGNGGRQIASTADGAFTVGFSDDCGEFNRCDVWGRNYDVRAVPQATTLAAGTAQYNFNRSQVFGTDPAIAIGPSGARLAVWMSIAQQNGNVADQILCSSIDAAGAPLTASEVVISPQPAQAVQQPSLVALGPSLYAATWNQVVPLAQGGTFQVILAILLDDSCRPQMNGINGAAGFFEVSARGGALDHPVVAGSGNRFGFVWGNGDGLRGRFTTLDGTFGGPETVLVEDDGPLRWGQQLVFAGERYMLTYGLLGDGAPGPELRVRPVSLGGSLEGTDTVLASGALDPLEAPALTYRADGAIGVAWHGCDLPDDPGCGVVARLVRPTGLPVGDPIHVNTTTVNDQRDPSIAPLPGAFVLAWTDGSGVAPDTSESGIRARVIYPPFDEAVGVLGAACGADSGPCNDGLVCIDGSDGNAYCHQSCEPSAPVCSGGGTCTTADGVSGCVF